jgi:RES domain-containing protein
MKVYRVAKPKRAKDLSGVGAWLAGGRWNREGSSVVYTAESASLAMLETLVHLNLTALPSDMCVATIEVPDNASVTEISKRSLPKEWWVHPPPDELKEIGKEWLDKGDTLLLCVPSAVSPHERNYLINPAHKDMPQVEVVKVELHIAYPRIVDVLKDKKKP